jgi:hypothetical protein
VESVHPVFNEERKAEIMLKVRFAVVSLAVVMLLPLIPALQAQAPAAPLPSQILTAKTVFISNAGADFDSNLWSGTPDRAYNEFYEAIKSWGRYRLVSTPNDADMVFEFSLVGTPLPNAQFRVVLLEPKTHVVLWTESEGIQLGLKKTRDKGFDDAINKLIDDLKTLTSRLQ